MKTRICGAGPRFLTDSFWGLALLLFALLLSMQTLRRAQENQAALLAPGVLRLHILADSSASADQEVKLQVRSLVLDWLSARRDALSCKADVLRLLKQQGRELTGDIDRRLLAEGVSYRSSLSLARCYFPRRVYGGAVFPCGFYEAARITLGSGRGHNWWCVLYPGLCLTDEAWDLSPAPNPRTAGSAAGVSPDETAGEGRSNGADGAGTQKGGPPASADVPPSVTISFRLLPQLKLSVPVSAPEGGLPFPAFSNGSTQDTSFSLRPPGP